MNNYDLITILGPTASGKTTLACHLAYHSNGEVISADSRQVYRDMNIGTGKDLDDYVVNNHTIPYHLIDICEAGDKYNIYQYQHDFHSAYKQINERNKQAILCGGSGLYIETILKNYSLNNVPENTCLRNSLEGKSLEELTQILSRYKNLHNKTDIDTAQRAIRAIEIEEYKTNNKLEINQFEPINSLIVGVDIERNLRRKKITQRLKNRLEEGMIDEIKNILQRGVAPDDLIYYGLEYKFVTLYILNELTYQEMFDQLEIAIHQFAKRQMTWFRGMEKRGLNIHWIDYNISTEQKIEIIQKLSDVNVQNN